MTQLTPRIGEIESIVHHLVPEVAAIPRVDGVAVRSSRCHVPDRVLTSTFLLLDSGALNAAFGMARAHFGYKGLGVHWGSLSSIVGNKRYFTVVVVVG